MDLVPDSSGRDSSGPDGYPFRNVTTGPGQGATPINGASHRADRRPAERHGSEHRAPEPEPGAVLERVAGDPAIADHPLVQGLLVELPDRDSALPDGWLDHWLEAARAVLELLYAQRPGTTHH